MLLREWVDDMQHGGSSVHPHRHLREADISSVVSEVRGTGTNPGGRGRGSLRDGMRRHLERAAEPELELDLSDEPLLTDELDAIDIEITEP